MDIGRLRCRHHPPVAEALTYNTTGAHLLLCCPLSFPVGWLSFAHVGTVDGRGGFFCGERPLHDRAVYEPTRQKSKGEVREEAISSISYI